MKNLFIILILSLPIYCFSQVRTVPSFTQFDPVTEIGTGVTIIGGPSIIGKEINITDVDDATNITIIIRTPSNDTIANPTYPNLLTLGSVMKIRTNNVTSGDTVYIREDGLGVNGRIGSPGYPITSNTKLDFVYTIVGWVERKDYAETETFLTSFSEIGNRTFNFGDYVKVKYTNGIATYKVQNDSIAGIVVGSSRAIYETANNKYAVIQPKNGYVDAIDFGAYPDGSVADDSQINNAVRFAIYNKIQKVGFSVSGEFDITNPIEMIYNPDNDAEYDFFSCELSGNIPNYGLASSGSSVFDVNVTLGPGLIIQKGRQVSIKNIFFEGDIPIGNLPGNQSEVVTQSLADWAAAGQRTNRYSPHCAIVIDPFASGMSASNQYPGFSSYYTNTSNGGSSHITIEGCGVRGFIVGIMVNPSDGVQNGDNIKFINGTARECYSFWATGQGQSKGNVIRDVYGVGTINTFVDCSTWGRREGAPPFISDCNLAGSMKNIVVAETGNTSRLHMKSVFAESVFQIGSSLVTTLIDGCRFSFMRMDEINMPGPAYTWRQGIYPATFKSCDFAYFSNGEFQYPFSFVTQGTGTVKIEDSFFDGGEILGNYPYQTSGTTTDAEGPILVNCLRRNSTGFQSYNEYLTSPVSNQYNVASSRLFESIRVLVTDSLPSIANPYTVSRMYIRVPNADTKLVVDDVLAFNIGGLNDNDNSLIGLVENVYSDSIQVVGVTLNYMDNRDVDIDEFRIIHRRRALDRVFGDLTSGNDTVKNVYNISAIKVGDFVDTPGGQIPNSINSRSRVLEKGSDWFIISIAPTGSTTKALIQDRLYKKVRTADNTDTRYDGASILNAWYLGDEMILVDKDTSKLICTKSGVYGTNWEPEFSPIVSQSYADLNLLEYNGGTIPGGRMIEPLTLEGSLVMEEDNGLIRFEKEDGTLIGSLGASISGGIGLLQWGEWFLVSKGSIHAGISDFQDTVTFNNSSDPNARVIFNIESQIEDGVNLVREQDTEFKVSFGRNKGQETDVDFDLISVLRGNHHDLEYFSKITDAATSNNVITLTDVGDNIPHMVNFYISAEDDDDLYDVELTVNGDSLIIRDTTISSYILQDNQTVHVKSVVLGGKRYYKIINPEKKGTYTNSSGSNQTVITITHNLGVTPNIVYITPTTDVGTWYVSNKNVNEVEITMSTGLANTESLQWFVDR